MKTQYTLIAAAIFAACSSNVVVADDSNNLIKEQPHQIYHVVKNKSLLETTNQLSNRTGITFKINPANQADVINQKLAAEDWNTALKQLLHGYNYTLVSNKGKINTVVITGRNGDGYEAVTASTPEANFVVVAPDASKKLPTKYKNFNAGSVMSVNLPMDQLANIPIGDDVTLDLPIGQYKVKHDNSVQHDDKSSTWVGYLDEEGKGYRIYLSQGETGVIGNVYTPDGAYNIETVDGQTVVVDIDKSGLTTAGYENDEVHPSANGLTSMNAAAAVDPLDALKTAADTARAAVTALTAQANDLYAKYTQAITATNNALALANNRSAAAANAKSQYNADQAAVTKSPKNAALKANLKTAKLTLNSANIALNKAIAAYNLAVKNRVAAQAAYAKKATELKTAEAKAKTAETAYASELAKAKTAVATNSSTASTTIDLMVLYTTTNQTAAYAKQRIQYLVDVSNQAYKDSGINLKLRLVHTRATSYVENNANAQALSDLASDRGAFAGTAALRNQYGADLVALFRPLYAQTAGSCGTAYVGFANGSGANAGIGFGTIGDGYSKDALSNYYCGANTFTHEIGHNLGNVHDREYSNVAGKFAYSYAWGINNKFGTIMSYYGPSVMLFSTPNLATQCAGGPCGFAEGNPKASDQVKTVNYTSPLIANYRNSTVTTPVIQ
ncbi:MAG: M12 family metallo-peptidase [Methylococcaceae bacterium]|nr:M12 family metallo-peptidase [Methylococcaceae bacterium]